MRQIHIPMWPPLALNSKNMFLVKRKVSVTCELIYLHVSIILTCYNCRSYAFYLIFFVSSNTLRLGYGSNNNQTPSSIIVIGCLEIFVITVLEKY